MATSTIVWIIVAVVAVVVIVGVLLWMARTQRDRRRAAQAEELRDHVRQESVKVQRREALADETAARARAAQAEADAKAAEAARLQERADTHRTEATTSRDRLDEKWAHADSLDPRAQSVETSQTTDDGVRENGGPLANEAPRTSPAPGRGN